LKTPQPVLQDQEQALLVIQQQLEDALAPLHGLVIHIVMISITTWTAVMMVETVVDVMFKQITAMYVDALIQMEAGVAQHAHKQLQALQVQQQSLQTLQQALQIQQQQLEAAMTHGLVIIIVMIAITTWTAAMIAETVVDVTLICHTVQYADALIQMEVAVEQLAHKQQQALQIHQTPLQIQLQLEDALATRDGLVMIIVMMKITMWSVAMMVETVADVTL
jgi:hypothetical protein